MPTKKLLPAAVVAALLTGLSAQSAPAQTGPAILLKPFRTTDQIEANLDAIYGFESDTDNSDADGDNFEFRVDEYATSGRFRLTLGTSEEGLARAQPRAGYQFNVFDLHTNDPNLPDNLFDASAGVGMGILAYNGFIGAISFGAGYATADFDNGGDGNAVYYQADLAVGKTFSNGDSFGVVLDYNGNRTFLPDWPLPGFQYRKRLIPARTTGLGADPTPGAAASRPVSERRGDPDEYDPGELEPAVLTLAIGVPTTGIEWRPTRKAIVNLNYLVPLNFDFNAVYYALGDEDNGLGLYASLERRVAPFHWNELDSANDRIFFRQVRLEGGVNYRFDDRFLVILSGGYAFDQEFDVGFDTRDTSDVAEVDSAPYVRAQLQLRL